MKRRRMLKWFAWVGISVFIIINLVAFFHAYKFTHFTNEQVVKTLDPQKLTSTQKLTTILFGVNNPRPNNNRMPTDSFETILLQSNKKIACWLIKVPKPKGTVILFHGFGGQKANMLDKAELFRMQGYQTLLVDFMGSGGSEGSQTSIGYFEAEQVKTCYTYLQDKGEKNIILFGTSMGAVAVMKAINDYGIQPKSIIIECPFGSMYQTVCARFKTMHAPTFPMAALLVFWGGVQNGFWAFNHNPSEYAKKITCPTLLLYGEKDEKVSKGEISEIYTNLAGKKRWISYAKAGHENYLNKYKVEWNKDVANFLSTF